MAAIVEPKKAMSSFFIFLGENREKFAKELGDNTGLGKVSSYASEKYKSLSAEQKKVYEQKAADAKAAYAKAMEEFKAQGGQAGQRRAEKRARKDGKDGKDGKKVKPADMPKKPAGGAFGCFSAEHRASIQASLPAGSPCTATMKIAGEQWKKISETDKAKYEKQYQEKKAAYEEAMKEWKAKQDAAGDGEDEEDGEEDAGDAANDDQVLEVPSPSKKARLSSSSKGKTEVNEKALAEAKTEGLATKLKSLMENPKVSNKDAATVLDALRKAGGKVVEAKKALLA